MPSNDLNNFKKILSNNGYKVTKARELTFNLLVNPEPQSMNEVIKKSNKKIDRVSIYRNIDLFEKLGIAHRVYTGWKYKIELSDVFIAHHHHLICISCGKIIDIEDEKHIDDFIKNVSSKVGFKPRRHTFEVDGYCKNCS